MLKEKASQQDKAYSPHPIAKTFLYIAGFIVLVRCDLWISLSVLIIAALVLFPAILIKKAKHFLRKDNLETITKQLQHWYEQNVNAKPDQQKATITCCCTCQKSSKKDLIVNKELISPTLPADIFKEETFDEIWQHCSNKSEQEINLHN